MEIYTNLSKCESLDELHMQLQTKDILEQSMSYLQSKCTFPIDIKKTKLFLSAYCIVLYPEAHFNSFSQLHIALSASDVIYNTNDDTFNLYETKFNNWKNEDLQELIESIQVHQAEIPNNSDDLRFSDGFALQHKVLNTALVFFNSLKNKINNEQQNNQE